MYVYFAAELKIVEFTVYSLFGFFFYFKEEFLFTDSSLQASQQGTKTQEVT